MRVLDSRKVQEIVKIQLHLEASREEWSWLLGGLSIAVTQGKDASGAPLTLKGREVLNNWWNAIQKEMPHEGF